MVAHSGFQPSPYHTQPPAFSSPLDKVINEAQSGPSSRVQLLQRAVTLTRNSSVKRPQQQQQQQQQTEEAGSYVNGADSRDGRNNAGLSGYRQQSAYPSSSTSQNPRQARNDQQYSNYDESHGYQQRIGGGGHNQEQRYAYPHAPTNESRQEYDGTAPSSHSDTRTNSNFTPSSQGSQSVNTASKEKERSRYSISDQVQNQRAARLSQQQAFTNHPEQKKNELNAPLSNAFRDSIASNISFNSITGSEDRSSMMMLNNFGAGGSGNNSIDDDGQSSIYGFANDADRIAREVRGLAMRRRPSMDTVRSSEFGEGGRWAQAWAGSDDGEDEEEDEMDLQAMRTRDMSTFDIESTGAQTGLGALGELGNLQGARAAMNGSGAESTSKNANQRQVLNTSHAQNMALPRVQDVTNAMHTVNLTSTHKPTLQDQSRFRHSSSQSPSAHQYGLHANPQSDLTRRDTIMSVSGEIGEVAESEQSPHKRNDSNATVSTLQGSEATSYSNNQHVKVWPPTPAVSERGTSTANHARVNRSDTLRASPGIGQMAMGQSATVEYASPPHEQQPSPQMNHKQSPAKPLSPSALLTQADHLGPSRAEQYGVLGNAVQSHSDSKPYAGYSDPNQHSFYAPPETFGKARQKAIADHDGRESMVSDLDVETLRLDGSSIAGGSRDEWDSRRGSTSTIGSVDTAILDEQRRRRSQMEQEEFDGQNKRTSTSTIRGQQTQGVYDNHRHPTLQQQSLHAPQGQNGVLMSGSGLLKRNVSHPSPTAEKGDPLVRGAPTPRRSNTLPEEQGLPPVNQMQSPRSNYATPNLSPAPWAKNSPAHSPLMQSGNLMSPSMRSTNLSTTSTLNSGAGKSTISTASNAGTGKRTSAPNQTAQSEAEKFLTLGISHHESGDLSRSAFYFERSAKIEGGCVVGMCMWGMALREGWGVRKDQKRGFEWISRAASKAGDLMGSSNGKTRNEAEIKAIRSELKLSVYELGKCFCYGWGVKQDRQMALEYFELAAKLGDSDAQAEAGALLAAGKGCKKDLKKAAMYYRMAEAQGYDTVGLSWIHKDKYDPVSVGKTKGGK